MLEPQANMKPEKGLALRPDNDEMLPKYMMVLYWVGSLSGRGGCNQGRGLGSFETRSA